ncbi:MAG: hypothetical protein ABL921_20705 [Pirellula sp.]
MSCCKQAATPFPNVDNIAWIRIAVTWLAACVVYAPPVRSQPTSDEPVRFATANAIVPTNSITAAAADQALASATSRPSAWPYQARAGQFQIHSVLPAVKLQPYLSAVGSLRQEMIDSLGVAITDDRIDVVVLDSRASLDAYARRLVSDAPSRRALYIRHRGPGLVLTFFHPEWVQDVRHECSHALLDASGIKLPLWQDEGLSEYFETVFRSPVEHGSHLAAICTQVKFGQIADLHRLEQTDASEGLSPKDYREAWSVIAMLLHSSPETRDALRGYLQDLQSKRAAGFLSHRISTIVPSWRTAYGEFYRR